MRIGADAIPGSRIPLWFIPIKTGTYEVICAQLCGLGHARMRGFVTVQTAEEFQKWMDDKVKEQSAPDPFR